MPLTIHVKLKNYVTALKNVSVHYECMSTPNRIGCLKNKKYVLVISKLIIPIENTYHIWCSEKQLLVTADELS